MYLVMIERKSPSRSPRVRAQFEAYAAVLKAAEDLQRGFTEMLKAHDLSPSQYNVLRVLRGAGPDGLACREVGDRLIRHDPDITRLLDRLEKRGLVERIRQRNDRRVVKTTVTRAGVVLLAGLDEPVDALHQRQLGHVSTTRLLTLSRLLQEATARVS
jgi:DNA-binding MarR family transcriptional regulator